MIYKNIIGIIDITWTTYKTEDKLIDLIKQQNISRGVFNPSIIHTKLNLVTPKN